MPEQKQWAQLWTAEQLEDFHRIYGLRSQLAGFAARHAALRARKGASCQHLQQAFTDMRAAAAKNDYPAFLNADMDFHRAIAEIAQVPGLPAIWKQLETEIRPFAAWAQRVIYRDLNLIAQSHEAQIHSICAGNAIEAEMAARLDLDSLWQMLAEQPAEPTDADDPVEQACAYIILNLHRKITLETVARQAVHLSASHLSKLFRQRRGQSIGAYIQELRMRRAQLLLSEGTEDVQAAARRVGYTDPSRFSEHFKRHFGCTPSRYSPDSDSE